MKIHIKAALLSAFVFPGLGQLIKCNRIKGLIIIGCVNIILLILVCLILQQLMPIIIAAQNSNVPDVKNIMERLHVGSPAIRTLSAVFCGIWMYGWIDAAVGKPGKE
jgi:TM2 domain-containing membrane protein YozV